MLETREYTLCSPFRANAHNSSYFYLYMYCVRIPSMEIHVYYVLLGYGSIARRTLLQVCLKQIMLSLNFSIHDIEHIYTIIDPW